MQQAMLSAHDDQGRHMASLGHNKLTHLNTIKTDIIRPQINMDVCCDLHIYVEESLSTIYRQSYSHD